VQASDLLLRRKIDGVGMTRWWFRAQQNFRTSYWAAVLERNGVDFPEWEIIGLDRERGLAPKLKP
jgi:hypothetical protein